MNEIQQKFLETLSGIIANPRDIQQYKYFWAIEEGFKRTELFSQNTYIVNVTPTARKNHECKENGCVIKPEEKYFQLGNCYEPYQICALCIAKLVLENDAHLSPVYEHDYWDEEAGHPHFDSTSLSNIKIKKAMDDYFKK